MAERTIAAQDELYTFLRRAIENANGALTVPQKMEVLADLASYLSEAETENDEIVERGIVTNRAYCQAEEALRSGVQGYCEY